ncbi:MAG: hypothetical protein AAF901_00815 [Bacteroidota bacterium]
MKLLKDIFNFYINSSIHVAIAVVAMTWVTYIELDIQLDDSVLLFIGFATITGYNFVKYFGLAKFHHRSLATWLKIIQIFSLLCFLAMCYYTLKLHAHSLMVIMAIAIITFFYAIPFLPKRMLLDKQQNLRQISGLKIYVIALVWAFVTVIIPVINSEGVISTDVIMSALQRFVFVLVLMLPFEIRDLNFDNLKLATIPQRIGVKKTKAIGLLLLVLFFLMEYFKDEVKPEMILSSLILFSITGALVLFSRKEQSPYYSAFWVESIPILWLGILLLLG